MNQKNKSAKGEEMEHDKESETRYRRLFETAQEGIIILDADTGKITDVNPFLVKLLGYSHEEFLGKKLREISPFKDIMSGQVVFSELPKKKYIRYEDLPLETKDGHRIDVEFVSNVYRVGRQRVIQCNIRDITERLRAEKALQEREQRLQFTERVANLGSWEMDIVTGKSVWSPGFFRICGFEPKAFEPTAEIWSALIYPDDLEMASQALSQAIAKKESYSIEHRIVRPDGTIIWVDSKGEVVYDASFKTVKLVGSFLDITERKQAQALQEAVYRIAIATETTSSLDDLFPQIHHIISSVMPADNFYITLYDEKQNVLRFPYFRDMADEPYLGEVEPGTGLTAYVLRTGKSLLCTQAVHDELERQGAVKLLGVPSAIWLGVPLIIESKTIGAMVVQHYSDPQAYGEREQHMLEFVSSQVAIAVTRKQAELELRYLSTHDVLTGLYNRVFFEEEMARLERGRQFPVSFVMADVDHLKETNDSQGHAAGDALLRSVAQVLTAAFRAEDVVARIGGDEFAVVLPGTGAIAAKAALKRARLMLQGHNGTQHGGTPLHLSLGMSTAKKRTPLTEVLKEADRRMYADKQAYNAPQKNH